MLVLQIIGGILAIAVVLFGLFALNKAYKERFDFAIFSTTLIAVEMIGVVFSAGGWLWYSNALEEKGDTLNGIVLIVIGALIILGVIYTLYKNTNFLFGTLGTAILLIKLAILTALLPILVVFVLLAIVGAIISFANEPKKVRIVK
ncbi:hypothetical protein CFY87_10015 [Actinobacillus seminis]|uniref:Uncharacterized protein n=1 Tax=Actinobacillus seminis TaxID=722 RepID=A0A263HCN5_9PAST|nr:hypothetical protein [Actinobacillus seminis]OZN24256.1 hypothetical protein CFY87_10015 [Actinobacillus seminis]SUU37603.1 Uncharacterised protein [Actinobacillus seminis]